MPLPIVPITHLLPKVIQQLQQHPKLILQAPPGAGKTTCLPLALLKDGFLGEQKILILEPRRLAASNAAGYMAKLLGEEVGKRVGYSIRYQRKISAATRIEVVTEGILTRRLQSDPELMGVGLIIFDEFHERHLQSDLALALCLDVQKSLREDLKLLIMSATLDANLLAEKLQAPLITSEGRSYPVTTHYLPGKDKQSIVDASTSAVHRALEGTDGDILVFLPGEGEIRRCQQILAKSTDILTCPLFGNLSFKEQEQAIQPAGQRKIVLATNIAETSLTIEGIRVVIDSGYSRQPRFDSGSGLTRLQLNRISQASAAQRAGRAGRLGPGHCYRLWSEGTQTALLPFTPAEIRVSDLSPLVLELLAWGITNPDTLFWLDPPSPTAWQQGLELLKLLGALNEQQQLNNLGQKLAELPIHPRLGKVLITAKEEDLLEVGCDLVALLSEPDPWFNNKPKPKSDSDLLDRLEAFWGQTSSHEFSAVARSSRYWRRYFKLTNEIPATTAEQLALLLAAAYPDRIGKQRQSDSQRYQLSSGLGVKMGEQSAVQNSELLIAVDLRTPKTGEAEIRLANRIERQTLSQLYPHLSWRRRCYWDNEQGRIIACEQQLIGTLVIGQRPGKIAAEQAQQAIICAIRATGLQLLKFNEKALRLRNRLQFLHSQLAGDDWPNFDEQSLLDSLDEWLGPFLGKVRNRNDLQKLDMVAALMSRLNWQQRKQLDRLAPEKLEVPSGSKIALQYSADYRPVLAVKLQEMFGQLDTPHIANGRVPIVIHLLSPAGRPLQITQDLRHFWEHSYPEVQKEMKGRYPKHPWPDDPLKALPTAKTKRKLAQQEK